jgi:hypothetical protein
MTRKYYSGLQHEIWTGFSTILLMLAGLIGGCCHCWLSLLSSFCHPSLYCCLPWIMSASRVSRRTGGGNEIACGGQAAPWRTGTQRWAVKGWVGGGCGAESRVVAGCDAGHGDWGLGTGEVEPQRTHRSGSSLVGHFISFANELMGWVSPRPSGVTFTSP